MHSPTAARRRITDLGRRRRLLEREAELAQIGARARPPWGARGDRGDRGSGRDRQELAARRGRGPRRGGAGWRCSRARGGVMEREFALGVVIQLLAPSVEALSDAGARAAVRRRRRARAAAVRGGRGPSGRRRSPVRALPRAALAVRAAGRGGAARPARRRRALGGRAFAALPGLPRRADRGDPRLRDRRRAHGRDRGGARRADAADRAP